MATCALDPSEIAYPIRGVFRKNRNLRFLLGTLTDVDYESQTITVNAQGKEQIETYDYLVIAPGTATNFFGNKSLEHHTFGLKTISEGVALCSHVLKLFEQAAWEKDDQKRQSLTTLVIVGGGPTELETARALYELYNFVLNREYGHSNGLRARVLLVEATNRLLAPYPQPLQNAALRQLEGLGVEVILEQTVEEVTEDQIVLSSGEIIHTHALIWAAG